MKGKTGAPTGKRNLSEASTTVATPQTLTTPPIPDAGLKRREDDDLFEDLMKASSKEDIMKKLRSPNSRRGKDKSDLETELDAELGGLRDMLHRMHEKGLGKMEVFVPCEGLLSVVVQGELANSRGLSIGDCAEYSRAYVDYDDVQGGRSCVVNADISRPIQRPRPSIQQKCRGVQGLRRMGLSQPQSDLQQRCSQLYRVDEELWRFEG